MLLSRFVVQALLGVGLGLLLTGSVSADGESPPPGKEAGERLERHETRPPGRRPRPGQPGDFRRRPPPPPRPHPPGPPPGIVPGRHRHPEPRGPHGRPLPPGPPRWPHHDWEALQKNDPEMHKLLRDDHDMERQTRELAMQYRRAPSQQRAAIRKQLDELVNSHFEVRQQRRLLELKRLEEELKRLHEDIDRRNEARQVLVGKRVSQLLGEDNDLDF